MASMSDLNDATKVAKLPLWAQEGIRDLQMHLKDARMERDALLLHQPASRMAIQRVGHHTGDGPPEHYMPERTRVRYYLQRPPDGPEDRVRLLGLEAHLRERQTGRYVLHLNCWAGEPHVLPVSGNCFDVEVY